MRRLRSLFMTLFFGAALGWVARGMGNESLEQQRRSALEKAGATEAKMTQLLSKAAEVEQVRQQLADAEATIRHLQAELSQLSPASPPPTTTPEPPTSQSPSDPLRQLAGIGPTFAKRLHEAGINSFADVAASSPERLREVVQAKAWQKVEPESWITQAQALMAAE